MKTKQNIIRVKAMSDLKHKLNKSESNATPKGQTKLNKSESNARPKGQSKQNS